MRCFSIVVLLLLSLSASAINGHIAIGEIGLNFGKLKRGYQTYLFNQGQAGFALGITHGPFIADVGLKLWTMSYQARLIVKENNNAPYELLSDTSEITNLSIPFSVGVTYSLNRIHVMAKAIVAPTILEEHTINFKENLGSGNKPVFNTGNKALYFAGGAEFGIGFFITPYFSADVKYTYLAFFGNLAYKNYETHNLSLQETPNGERPVLHGLGLQMNLFFGKQTSIVRKSGKK